MGVGRFLFNELVFLPMQRAIVKRKAVALVRSLRMTATVDDTALQRRLAALMAKEIPSAMRNTLNDLARGYAQSMGPTIAATFDRPTPFVQRSMRVTKRATKTDLSAEVSVPVKAIDRALSAHIPETAPVRKRKNIELWAEGHGLISAGQWLMPSRSFKLDQYGNVPLATMRRMVADVMRGTARLNRKGYIWLTIDAKGKAPVTGIWRFIPGGDVDLQMMLVETAPRYTKRFAVQSTARAYASAHVGAVADRAVAQAIRRRG